MFKSLRWTFTFTAVCFYATDLCDATGHSSALHQPVPVWTVGHLPVIVITVQNVYNVSTALNTGIPHSSFQLLSERRDEATLLTFQNILKGRTSPLFAFVSDPPSWAQAQTS